MKKYSFVAVKFNNQVEVLLLQIKIGWHERGYFF